MTVYYFFIAFVIILGLAQYFYFPKNKVLRLCYIGICGLLFFLISAFRYGIGFDYYSYLDAFDKIKQLDFTYSSLNSFSMELGFTFLVKVLTMITSNWQIIYGVFAAIIAVVISFMVYKYSDVPLISIYLCIVLNFYFCSMNMVRYAVASIIVFLSYALLQKSKFDFSKKSFEPKIFWSNMLNNFFPYLLLTIIACLFHKSAIIMIPIYFACKLDLNKITGTLYTVATAILFFVSKPLVHLISENFFDGFYNPYVATGDIRDTFREPAGLFYIYVPAIVLIAALILKKKLLQKNPANIVLINMSIYSFIIYFLSATRIYIFNRVAYFPSIFMVLTAAEIVSVLRPSIDSVARLAEIKKELKSSNKNEQKKLAKEQQSLKSTVSDASIFHLFAVGVVIFGGILYFNSHYDLKSNGVYPYLSVSPTINRINTLNFNNNREKRIDDLNKVNSFDYLLMELNDPDYAFIFTTQILSADQENLPYIWQQDHLKKFGLVAELQSQVGNNYIAVVDGCKAVSESVGQDEQSASLDIDGLKVDVSVDNKNSSIKIDGKEYSTQQLGGNVVVYDKKLNKVVYSANMYPTFRAYTPVYQSMYYSTKQVLE